MGRALPDKTAPGQTGHGLGMAHHYRTPGVRNKAQLRAGGYQFAGNQKDFFSGSPGATNGSGRRLCGGTWKGLFVLFVLYPYLRILESIIVSSKKNRQLTNRYPKLVHIHSMSTPV